MKKKVFLILIPVLVAFISYKIYVALFTCGNPNIVEGIEIYSCPMTTSEVRLFWLDSKNYIKSIMEKYSPNFTKDSEITIFDVGGNIGLFSLLSAKLYPKSKIYSFEPIQSTYEIFLKNMKHHGYLNTIVHPFRIGLSDKEQKDVTFVNFVAGFAMSGIENVKVDSQLVEKLVLCQMRKQLWYFGDYLGYFLVSLPGIRKWSQKLFEMFDVYSTQELVKADLSTISTFIDEHDISKIDILKIDAEGSEFDILKGIRDEHWEKICYIAMEVHPIKKFGGDPYIMKDKIVEVLKKRDFDISWEDDVKEMIKEGFAREDEYFPYLISLYAKNKNDLCKQSKN